MVPEVRIRRKIVNQVLVNMNVSPKGYNLKGLNSVIELYEIEWRKICLFARRVWKFNNLDRQWERGPTQSD